MEPFDDVETVEAVANRVTPVWEQVIDDMETTAAAYREDGWDTIVCHPGDVTAIGEADVERDDARTGIDILVPGDEFERVAAAVDGPGAFDEVEAFRAEQAGFVFFVAALENDDANAVVLVPAYYEPDESFLETVHRSGRLQLHVRPLDQRRIVTFIQDDPTPFLPGEPSQ